MEEHRRTLLKAEGFRFLPGAAAAIERMSSWPLGLVTGSSRDEAMEVLSALDVRGHFSVVLAAEDVPTSKPDPRGYLMAAEALRAIPEACLVVEDSEPGIEAARRAGMRVVAVKAGNVAEHDQRAAHHFLDTLEGLNVAFVERAMVPAL